QVFAPTPTPRPSSGGTAMPRLPARLALAALVAIVTIPANAAEPIRVGVTVSQTGPAASLGIPQRNTVALLPTEIGGHEVKYILLDDASDTTKAVANTRKL